MAFANRIWPLRLVLPLLLLLTTVTVAPPASSEEPTASSNYQMRIDEDGQKIFKSHAIAMHGEPKYGPDFTHFAYVNPDAPKGGRIREGARGTFDSFHPWIARGSPVHPGGDTLLVTSADEAFTEYCLICETLEWPEDRSWVIFNLRPEARWHDGKAITPEDVVFSLDILKEKGRPIYRFYYASVERVEKIGPRRVKFFFAEQGNRELPLIAGQLPILPKHYWEPRDFEKTTLEPPLTSGSYKITDWEPGRFIVRERVENYWARDLPVNRGQHNFDRIRTNFYRDVTVIRQALKAGDLDYRDENTAKSWATEFDIPAVRNGLLNKRTFAHQRPTGMQAFVFNTRRELFGDPKVRQAIGYAFDFEWTNPVLFFDQYTRNYSYFGNSELASTGLPKGRELEILEDYRGRIPEEVFTTEFIVPKSDGSGWPRENLLMAWRLLEEAGWEVDGKGVLRNRETGDPFVFEMLLVSAGFQRIVLPLARNLKRLGIDMKVRLVDSSQYINRYRAKDFDMMSTGWGQSDSPGNEQRDFWSTAAADASGSRNLAGIRDPVVDELIELLIQAPTREELVARTRALDRVLLWGHYVIPAWHLRVDRVLYWDKFAYPQIIPNRGTSTSYWWFDEAKAAALAAKLPSSRQAQSASGNGERRFDGRKLLGLTLLVVLIAVAWFALGLGGKRRDERSAVIEP